MIPRLAENTLRKLAAQFKAVAVIGPRQSGKTTLTRHVFPDKPYVSLENPDIRRFASEDPRGFLAQFPEGAILDEAQRQPELFSYLQQILDDTRVPGKFIITGSNHFLLQENISQTLAGRIAYLVLLPFSGSELPPQELKNLSGFMLKGCYPPVFDQPVEPEAWYVNYLRTYVERDVRQIKNISDLYLFDRFLRLCAGRTGQLLNMSNLAIETGVDSKTIAAWIGVLESSFIVHRLHPHHRNFNKRIVRMPKLYFYDTGLVCSLLGIRDTGQLVTHPLAGSIFETLVVSEMKKHLFNNGLNDMLFFWRDSIGHEVDVVIESGKQLHPVEIKSGQTITPAYFKNLEFWSSISGEKGGSVIYTGDATQHRSNGISVIPWNKISMVFPELHKETAEDAE